MRIAIDASRTTTARTTGTEHYALELLRHLIRENDTLPQPHHLRLYFRDTPPSDLLPTSPHTEQVIIPFTRVWTHLRFAAALYHDRPDLTFVPAHTLPFVMPGRAMVTVHDLGYRHFPQLHPLRQRLYLEMTTRYSTRRADIVLADSEATRADLMRFYHTPADKIHVVYPAASPPIVSDVDVRVKYRLPARYFVFIGTLQPRKNIAGLVQAYKQYRQRTGDDAALVLAGGRGWLYDEAWTGGVSGVIETGYIEEADKGALLAGSLGLVFPSLYEGFGFPVLEAMFCHTPVIASRTSSLPELVGEAGLLVDPLDTDAIAAAMEAMVQPEVRERLVRAGDEQVQRFTWQTSARQVLNLIGR